LKFTKAKLDNPRDPVSARKLNLKLLRKSLELKDIHANNLQQQWRHVHGKVTYADEILFFKLATTQGIAKATRNEVKWNKHVNLHLSKNSHFRVPEIRATGIIDGKFYYLSDYIDGNPLSESSGNVDTSLIADQLENLSHCFYEITKLPKRSFVWDATYKNLQLPGKKFFKRALWFFKEIGEPPELLPILESSSKIETLYRPALAHGDFTPWHVFLNKKDRLVLTDGEWANSCLPEYYDLAYCYHRMCSCIGAFDLAKSLISKYRKLIKKSELNKFDNLFYCVLAERVLGGFWDSAKMVNTAEGNLISHKQLKDLFLKKDLY
jgi:hypothetical protein